MNELLTSSSTRRPSSSAFIKNRQLNTVKHGSVRVTALTRAGVETNFAQVNILKCDFERPGTSAKTKYKVREDLSEEL